MGYNWSMGIGKLDGKILRHPSGRLAAALKADSDPDGNIVGLHIDKNELGAEEYNLLTKGHKRFSLKTKMLRPGLPGVRKSKDGFLYRFIPISDNPISPKQSYKAATHIKNLFTIHKNTDGGGVLGINRNLARMWTSNYKKAHAGSSKLRTMSNRPGSAAWIIPEMPAFNVQKLLREMLPKGMKSKVMAR